MIPKTDLLDGALYKGRCRNATEARWDAKIGRFKYRRRLYGDEFAIEEMEHSDDYKGYDVFTPEKLIEENKQNQSDTNNASCDSESGLE